MPTAEEFLKAHGIEFDYYEHPPVFTVAEAKVYCAHIPGLSTKNLLLTNKKKTRFVLFILPGDDKADFKKLKEVLGEKFSFASADILEQKLGVKPGSVSPFGVINNNEHDVEILIERRVYNADLVRFHPNRNAASVVLSKEMFRKFLDLIPNKWEVLDGDVMSNLFGSFKKDGKGKYIPLNKSRKLIVRKLKAEGHRMS